MTKRVPRVIAPPEGVPLKMSLAVLGVTEGTKVGVLRSVLVGMANIAVLRGVPVGAANVAVIQGVLGRTTDTAWLEGGAA